MIHIFIDQGSSTYGCVYTLSFGKPAIKPALRVPVTGCSPQCNATVTVTERPEADFKNSFYSEHVNQTSVSLCSDSGVLYRFLWSRLQSLSRRIPESVLRTRSGTLNAPPADT